jgi:hypothetical protein
MTMILLQSAENAGKRRGNLERGADSPGLLPLGSVERLQKTLNRPNKLIQRLCRVCVVSSVQFVSISAWPIMDQTAPSSNRAVQQEH